MPSSGHGRRGGRRGTRVRVVFAGAAVGGSGGRGGMGARRRRRTLGRAVAGVGAQRRGGQLVQEVEVRNGFALLVAEPHEKVAPAHDRLAEARGRTPEHAETVTDSGR